MITSCLNFIIENSILANLGSLQFLEGNVPGSHVRVGEGVFLLALPSCKCPPNGRNKKMVSRPWSLLLLLLMLNYLGEKTWHQFIADSSDKTLHIAESVFNCKQNVIQSSVRGLVLCKMSLN